MGAPPVKEFRIFRLHRAGEEKDDIAVLNKVCQLSAGWPEHLRRIGTFFILFEIADLRMGKPFAQLFQRVVGIRFRLQDFRAALPGVSGWTAYSPITAMDVYLSSVSGSVWPSFSANRPCSGDFLRCFMLFGPAIFRLLRLWPYQKF